jgi:hypothetical protein
MDSQSQEQLSFRKHSGISDLSTDDKLWVLVRIAANKVYLVSALPNTQIFL